MRYGLTVHLSLVHVEEKPLDVYLFQAMRPTP